MTIIPKIIDSTDEIIPAVLIEIKATFITSLVVWIISYKYISIVWCFCDDYFIVVELFIFNLKSKL